MLHLVLLAGLLPAASAQNSSSRACVTGNAVHMIVARASLEPPGQGVLANISQRVTEQLAGSNAEAVAYPATLDNYQTSEGMGVAAMTQLLSSYVQACPDSRVVLMGYSQGAQVTADTVCGSTVAGFASTPPVNRTITDKIAAIMLMGDPTHTVNQTFAQGTATKNSIFPRTNSSSCDPVQGRMVSFCNSGDTFCDSGQNLTVHLSYVQDNGTAAVEFILQKASQAVTAGSRSGSSSGSGSSSTNPAARTQGSAAAVARFLGILGLLLLK